MPAEPFARDTLDFPRSSVSPAAANHSIRAHASAEFLVDQWDACGHEEYDPRAVFSAAARCAGWSPPARPWTSVRTPSASADIPARWGD
ncbi:hypothetical protein [Saccharothrix lopnurensis]|uniref:Uncharacterized protein n=1 Tax=Saccharothrix lopnurensis TaxID=1670621 RepID=A0ABW1PCV2_9PSEU